MINKLELKVQVCMVTALDRKSLSTRSSSDGYMKQIHNILKMLSLARRVPSLHTVWGFQRSKTFDSAAETHFPWLIQSEREGRNPWNGGGGGRPLLQDLL